MALLHGVPESKAVGWVRLLYRADAVETDDQREWIKRFAHEAYDLTPQWPADGRSPAAWVASFVNYVCLLYHEARNVRFLIRDGYVQRGKFDSLVSLPANREKAWAELANTRKRAGTLPTVSAVIQLFEGRLRASIEELADLFTHEGWRHSKIGGNAWTRLAQSVIELHQALEAQDPIGASRLLDHIPKSSHNTGCVGEKLRGLNAWS